MIYLDTSVVLAHVFSENKRPPDSIWNESLTSSRLLQYECWVRLLARGLAASHGEILEKSLERIAFIEMTPVSLAEALKPFPNPVRTLDALHLASAKFLQTQKIPIQIASYDERFLQAAKSLGLSIFDFKT